MSQNQQRIAHPLDDSPSIPHTPPSQGATTSLETPSAATFTLFKKLSAELQIMIWERACLPQIIRIFCESNSARNMTPIPPILHACSASRHVALQTYKLMERKRFCRPFYYDSARDVILLKNIEDFRIFFWEYIVNYPSLLPGPDTRKAKRPCFRHVAIAVSSSDFENQLLGIMNPPVGAVQLEVGIMKLLDKVDHFTLLRTPQAGSRITKQIPEQITKHSTLAIDHAILLNLPSPFRLYSTRGGAWGFCEAFLQSLEVKIAIEGPWTQDDCSEEDKNKVITLDSYTMEEFVERMNGAVQEDG